MALLSAKKRRLIGFCKSSPYSFSNDLECSPSVTPDHVNLEIVSSTIYSGTICKSARGRDVDKSEKISRAKRAYEKSAVSYNRYPRLRGRRMYLGARMKNDVSRHENEERRISP